ncbi:MAG TPA: hypothetical protein VLH08_09395, partial [Acidobacteriota bacterium]|nr:hypothetical protein [Acidobacteriota bacterium]
MSIYGPGGNTPGTNLNRLMDSMGFPDTMGDIYGASLDAAVGNNLGVARNLFDAFSPLSTRQLDRMMTGGFNPPGFCHRPHDHFGHHFHLHAHKHYQRENVQTFNTGNPAFEMQLWANPAMRAGVEQMMGGRVRFDGNPFDGKIDIARPNPHPCLPFHHQINRHCQNILSRLMMPGMAQNVLQNLANALGSMF